MAYRLRVYAPTGQGVGSIWVRDAYNNVLKYAEPAGTGTPCADLDITDDIIITFGVIDNTTIIDNWKINYDNTTTENQNTNECTITYSSAYSNVYVLLSVKQSGQPEWPGQPDLTNSYYLNVSLNLNGGSWSGYTPSYGVDYGIIGPDADLYVAYTLPSGIPVRSGYTFAGWYCSQTGLTYSAGYSNRWYGSLSTSGQPYTFVAQWSESSTEGVWVYYGGTWKKAIPYVYYGGAWKKATPYVFYNGAWKKSTI